MKDAFDYAITFSGFQTKITSSELIYFDKVNLRSYHFGFTFLYLEEQKGYTVYYILECLEL